MLTTLIRDIGIISIRPYVFYEVIVNSRNVIVFILLFCVSLCGHFCIVTLIVFPYNILFYQIDYACDRV